MKDKPGKEELKAIMAIELTNINAALGGIFALIVALVISVPYLLNLYIKHPDYRGIVAGVGVLFVIVVIFLIQRLKEHHLHPNRKHYKDKAKELDKL